MRRMNASPVKALHTLWIACRVLRVARFMAATAVETVFGDVSSAASSSSTSGVSDVVSLGAEWVGVVTSSAVSSCVDVTSSFGSSVTSSAWVDVVPSSPSGVFVGVPVTNGTSVMNGTSAMDGMPVEDDAFVEVSSPTERGMLPDAMPVSWSSRSEYGKSESWESFNKLGIIASFEVGPVGGNVFERDTY